MRLATLTNPRYFCPYCQPFTFPRTLSTTSPTRKRTAPRKPLRIINIDGTTDFGTAVDAVDLAGVKKRTDLKRRQGGRTFLDHLVIDVQAGKGGDGAVAFFRDAHVPNGPPSGGNGGPGGDVCVQAVPGLTSLGGLASRIRGNKGGMGAGKWRHGRRGAEMVIRVPVGTVVREVPRPPVKELWEDAEGDEKVDEEEKERRRRARLWVHYPQHEDKNVQDEAFLQAEAALKREMRHAARHPVKRDPLNIDLDTPGDPVVVARGGQGGVGNPFFASTENRSPKFATRGRDGERVRLFLELKLLADVGLVGLPNAGKSTLLRALTNAKAEVAGYAFTTLNPQIGTVRLWEDGAFGSGATHAIEHTADERAAFLQSSSESTGSSSDWGRAEAARLTICDNPGLLARASEDVGLGHTFLRSVERARALVYVLDLSAPAPWDDLAVLRAELEAYRAGLSARGRLVLANKADLLEGQGEGEGGEEKRAWEKVRRLEEAAGGMDVVPVSAKFRLGLERVVRLLRGYVEEGR